MTFRRTLTTSLAPLLASLLTACAGLPAQEAPQVDVPATFKYAQGWLSLPLPGTQAAADAPWWHPFDDDTLDDLLQRIERDSPRLAQAQARYRQVASGVASARAGRFPTLDGALSATRSGSGDGVANRLSTGIDIRWVPDLWRRIDLQVAAAEADHEAARADLAAARLSLQILVAQRYLDLRMLDLQQDLLRQTEAAYERSLTLTRNQYNAGLVARADVVQAETQREDVRAQRIAVAGERRRAESDIAVLIGTTPSLFSLAPDGDDRLAPPAIPQALPAHLLARRPDVVAAERGVAAANARIGIASRAWLPDISLSASAGFASERAADWFTAPARIWSLGPQLAASLFDGGLREAELKRVEAAYDEQASRYRDAVLTAIGEVEDALAQLDTLAGQAQQQQRVTALAEENERLVDNRYRAGMVSFLEVSVAQNTTLAARRAALTIRSERLQASLKLISALGGDWQGLPALAARQEAREE